MKKKKWILYIVVALLVVLLCLLFVTIFGFEKDTKPTEEELPEVTTDLIDQLYSYLPLNEMGLHTMYTGYYNTINNISNDIILSMVYEYIVNNDEFKLENTSIDEMLSSQVISNASDITPLYKVKVSEINAIFPKIFGSEAKFKIADFRYDYKTLAKVDSDKEYFYIYNNTPLNTDKNDIVFKSITKYAVTENNRAIEIYDYYLKCDLNTNNCYNDEEKRLLNSSIKYTENFDINNYQDKLMIYKHTFKYEDGYYYWFSSDIAD